METYKTPVSIRSLGTTSLVLGVLGGAFYWWTPMGMVLSLAGWVLGLVGWVLAIRHTASNRLVIGGMVVSIATLILNMVIAWLGLEFVRFHDLR